jgi:hypothetical protein
MSRRPLAADLWEQALLNGRRIHPSDDAAALAWAEGWYGAQGGGFDGPAAAVEPAPDPDPAPEPAPAPEPEPAAAAPEAAKPAKPRKRARVEGGQFKGDDPATPETNEAWEGSDVG